MARQQITLNDPSRFKDPANLTWERYVALQARERERYLAERAAIPADAMAYQTVSPRYIERAVDQFRQMVFGVGDAVFGHRDLLRDGHQYSYPSGAVHRCTRGNKPVS